MAINNGYLSQYFESVAAKILSAVEVDANSSNQHEFNGTRELKEVLRTNQPVKFLTKFLWMEEENSALSEDGFVTWYDARANHPRRSEYRLYFPSNSVMQMAREGDTLFIAKRTDGTLLIIISSSETTVESQLYWLFGLSSIAGTGFEMTDFSTGLDQELNFAARFVMDELGIEMEEPENEKLDSLLLRFNRTFPTTAEFSRFARETYPNHIDIINDPDNVLLAFMDWEEKLFRRLERHIVEARLSHGFMREDGQDVDGFISFSLSVQNRRKSRAGYAFEDHVSAIMNAHGLTYTRKAETEHKSKPDFLFPGMEQYKDLSYPETKLTMLGAKTSCKDRWRQVTSEAARIKEKHLLTLEPSISENQTAEMRGHNVQLILPKGLHQTFSSSQQKDLLSVMDFFNLIKHREALPI